MDQNTPTQDGMTPQQWLDRLFETEYCDCCGLDKEDHEVCSAPFGVFFSRCVYHPDIVGAGTYVERYREVHGREPEPGSF